MSTKKNVRKEKLPGDSVYVAQSDKKIALSFFTVMPHFGLPENLTEHIKSECMVALENDGFCAEAQEDAIKSFTQSVISNDYELDDGTEELDVYKIEITKVKVFKAKPAKVEIVDIPM